MDIDLTPVVTGKLGAAVVAELLTVTDKGTTIRTPVVVWLGKLRMAAVAGLGQAPDGWRGRLREHVGRALEEHLRICLTFGAKPGAEELADLQVSIPERFEAGLRKVAGVVEEIERV